MTTGTAFSRKTESVLTRINPSAINTTVKSTASTRTPDQLSRHQLGAYFAKLDQAAFQVLMIWNGTDQPKDRQEFTHHLILNCIAQTAWFSESAYINTPEYRNRVDTLIQIALHNLTHAKRLTKIKQSEMIGQSYCTYKAKWEPRLIELETYIHQLLNQAAQQMHGNI